MHNIHLVAKTDGLAISHLSPAMTFDFKCMHNIAGWISNLSPAITFFFDFKCRMDEQSQSGSDIFSLIINACIILFIVVTNPKKTGRGVADRLSIPPLAHYIF